MKSALIVGAAGYIGTFLTKHLMKSMHVYCIDDLSNGSASRFKHVNKNVMLHETDIVDYVQPVNLSFDYVFDLAYINGTAQFYNRGVEILQTASKGIQKSTEIAKANGAKLVYFSTPEVFGNVKEIPTPESYKFEIADIYNPRWSYAVGKIYGEAYLHSERIVNEELNYNIVRPNNAYGQYDRYHVIPDLIKLIRSGTSTIPVLGNPASTRSYCYIEDMVKQIEAVAIRADCGETFNLGNPIETSLQDLVNMIIKVSGKSIQAEYDSAPAGSPQRRCPLTSKIDQLLTLDKTTLEDGLTVTFQKNDFDPYVSF